MRGVVHVILYCIFADALIFMKLFFSCFVHIFEKIKIDFIWISYFETIDTIDVLLFLNLQ